MRSSSLAKRLRHLEDIEQLTALKHRYCDYCDRNYDPDALAELFLDDGIWDGGPMGQARTKEGIRKYFAKASTRVRFSIHHVTNPLFDVNGNLADARWYLWQPMVMRASDSALWFAARYFDVCERVDGRWLFRSVRIEMRMLAPYDVGFGAKQVVDVGAASRQST